MVFHVYFFKLNNIKFNIKYYIILILVFGENILHTLKIIIFPSFR